MNKTQGAIMDIGLSAAAAAGGCLCLSLVDFHPVAVFLSLIAARYGKLTLARRVAGLRLIKMCFNCKKSPAGNSGMLGKFCQKCYDATMTQPPARLTY